MLDGNWSINYTFADRYELTGITDFILEYTKEAKNELVIIDVGCSKGSAMKYAQDFLKQKKINSFTIGFDFSKNIVNDAKKNLNEFVNQDVTRINNYDEKADIVICSKAAIFVTGKIRYNIIKKCSELLKNDGVLITDVDCFEKTSLLDELRLFQYIFPSPSCFKNGLKGFYKEWRRRQHTRLRKKMKKMDKITAFNYAQQILTAGILFGLNSIFFWIFNNIYGDVLANLTQSFC